MAEHECTCTNCGGRDHCKIKFEPSRKCCCFWKPELKPIWIPVEDDLPEIGYSVLVTRKTESNTRYIRIASRQDDCWMDNTDKYGKPNPHQVIAWMPMPDAYEPPKE